MNTMKELTPTTKKKKKKESDAAKKEVPKEPEKLEPSISEDISITSINSEDSQNLALFKLPEHLIAEKYRVTDKIAAGGQAILCVGEDINTKEKVAIKYQDNRHEQKQLEREYKVYQQLGIGSPNLPKVRVF